MATIKVKFRPSSVKDHEGTIFFQIIHRRQVRQLHTDYRISPEQWSDDDIPSQSAPTEVSKSISDDITHLSAIIRKLRDSRPGYTADDIIDEYLHHSHLHSLFTFTESLINGLNRAGRIRTAETYTSALNSFRRFRNDRDILLEYITPEIMENYQSHLRDRHLTPNTISFYMRILRAIYNRAVDRHLTTDHHPFRRVYTGIDKTVKRALPLDLIRTIKSLNLADNPALDHARDIFLLSFMLRGMSFVDMAFLRKTDLINGEVRYRRRKTGQLLTIRWTDEMQRILAKYPENPTSYLLPIIRKPNTNERCAYRNAAYAINRSLKHIARMAGITTPLTLYVARHSWATAARTKGIPLRIISEGMGHDSETTTQIYLASIDTSAIDRANALILHSL